MGWAVVCMNVRPSEKRMSETERERKTMCIRKKTFKRQHNGQYLRLGVFIQNSELLQHQGIEDCWGFKN